MADKKYVLKESKLLSHSLLNFSSISDDEFSSLEINSPRLLQIVLNATVSSLVMAIQYLFYECIFLF